MLRVKKNASRTEHMQLIFIMVLSVIMFLNFTLSNDYVSLLCTISISIYILTCKRKFVLPTMVYFSLFAYIFLYQKYEIYICLVIAFLTRGAILNVKLLKTFLVIFPIYIVSHLLSTSVSDVTITNMIPFFVIFCLFFACGLYEETGRELYIRYFVFGLLISSILGLFKSYTRLNLVMDADYLTANKWNDTVRFSGLSFDANFYSLICLTGIISLLFDGNRGNQKISPWLICSFVAFGLLTYSKSFFICVILSLAIALFNSDKNTKKVFCEVTIALAVLSLIFRNKVTDIFSMLSKRFNQASDLNGFTSGRTDLWENYISAIFKSFDSLIGGNGFGYSGFKAAHNTFLEILYKFGILGALIDVLFVLLCIKVIGRRQSKITFVSISLLIIFTMLLVNLSAYTFYSLWSCTFIVIILLRNPTKEKLL